jgi:hypothetical protein
MLKAAMTLTIATLLLGLLPTPSGAEHQVYMTAIGHLKAHGGPARFINRETQAPASQSLPKGKIFTTTPDRSRAKVSPIKSSEFPILRPY